MSSIPLNLAPMTELDAVNSMLLSIGQAPVNTLEVAGIKDVSFARLTLHDVSRSVQTRGWFFNRDIRLPLPPAVDGVIALPANTLQVAGSDPDSGIVERGGRLYDTRYHTDVFEKPVEVDLVRFLAFTDLPQAARNYIAARAGRVFQANIIGSQVIYAFTKEMELEALALLQQAETRSRRVNMLTGPTRMNAALHRNRWSR